MEEKYKIEKNIRIPISSYGDYRKYPLAKMKKGDSFFIPVENPEFYRVASMKVRQAATQFSIRHENRIKFTVRKVENGVRVWCI